MALGLFWATVSLVVFLLISTADMLGYLKPKNHFDVDGKTVVVTGGSQGMGRALGKLLAQRGANVVIVARDRQKLEAALKYISAAAKDVEKQRFHYISADVTKSEENIRIVEEVTSWNNGNSPDVVWANAGGAYSELFIDTPVELMRSQMDLNYFAAAYLAHATLRSWLRPASTKQTSEAAAAVAPRHFIITSSVVCFVGLAGYSPYAPAKSALRSLADSLRSEVRLYNGYRRANPSKGPAADVEIHCVTPGTIFSPGLDNENKTKPAVTHILEESDPRQTEDEAATAAIKGLERGGYLITTQWLGSLLRAGMLGGVPRNAVFMDTMKAWLTPVIWLFMQPDLEGKVLRWGEKNEVKLPQ
ncbi:3-dehydrosphinganine reductase [Saxophila tyrrhenica]|uniref:3-dehydrosphinganine reductase n=1 Tax=Saxophila tyrrhenica TaxID=1690608 RepID=A0AAV9P5S5_9PEZI|nr:3-dehydrosphinganine reductase [Saxophila tyrrhenica]